MATILVVDDRPSNRQFLTTLLGYGGHTLIEAGDGAAALEMVRSRRPELVITDILMPIMDGYELVQRIRADAEIARTSIIFYTASYSAPQAEALAKSCDVHKVLAKPSEPEDVLAAVSEALGAAPKPLPVTRKPAPPDRDRSIDDSITLYMKDLEEVRARFEDVISRSATLRAERESIKSLSRKFAENVASMQRVTARLSALLEVGMEMMSERDPARLIELFFAAACDLIDARYAAVGMLDEKEEQISIVRAKGFDADVVRQGAKAGLFASLLAGEEVMKSAPEGLPSGHPRVRDLVAVPVASADRVYGWMYFADSRGKDGFTDEDARVLKVMTRKLALLYENALLYDEIQRHAARLQIEAGERKRAQQALAESEAGLRRAQAMAKLGHVITGAVGEFLSWSDTLPGLVGRGPAEMPPDTREWLKVVHPDDRALFRAKAVAAGVTHERMELEYRLRKADGAWIHVRQTMEPLDSQADGAGRLRWFNTLQDVTEERRAAERLRESELRFREMAENIRDVFFLQNSDSSQIYYVSPAYEQIWGRSCESLYANPASWAESIHPEDVDEAFRKFTAGRHTGFDYEFRILRPDGEPRWIHVRGFPILDDDGKPYRTAGVASDITERKRAEVKIRKLNRVHAVLSGINTLIVRARHRDELFREACRIAVADGRFRMAWIGLANPAFNRVEPVAADGEVGDFFRSAPLALQDARAKGEGLAWRAIRERRPMISNDVQTDPQTSMKQQCRERGINSLVVLPLTLGEDAIGILALYAAETGFFDDEEMKLLLELAGDLSFALDHLQKEEKLEYLAYYDALTGLPNRTLLHERLTQQVLAARSAGSAFALLWVDLDRFKTINDSLGRSAGDALLAQVAQRLALATPQPSSVARVGPDEFAILITEVRQADELVRMIDQRGKDCFGEPFKVADTELRISAKAGVALYPSDGEDAETLFKHAEAAVEKAKQTGERYLFYTQEMTARVAEKLTLENKLRQALANEEFVLFYQPKVDLESRSVVGVEALIRWQSPERGLVPPAQFIPLLEETGLILQVGAWALARAAREHRAWEECKLRAPRVAVNVSQIQLRQRDFVAVVQRAIAGGVAPTAIDLEITESLVMEDIKANIEKLKAVRALGVRVAIDDFGTGYSSLAYLAQLPVESLKIDRSFIIRMQEDPNAMTLVSTIISLAHSLRLKVIAEGVETEDQARFLRLLRCDEMQGYLFSKPVPEPELRRMLG